jgi:hypothetical protein
MNDTKAGLSFRGCRTRGQAMEKFETWLDDDHAEQLRRFGARLVTENLDVPEIASQINQLQAFLASTRGDTIAIFAAALDKLAAARDEAVRP